jgi:hypothetical protein
MRAGRHRRTIGRAIAIALVGLGVTVAGIQAANADWTWDSPSVDSPSVDSPSPASDAAPDGTWGTVVEKAASTASDWTWD